MGKSLLVPIASPTALHHPIRILTANLDRPIGAERIHDHNLIAPLQALQTFADTIFLVEANDDG